MVLGDRDRGGSDMAKPENYQDVDQRVHEFWERFPNGRIRTEMHRCDEHQVIFLAGVFRDGREGSHQADATGWAEEKFEGRMEKWALETCETSAIGRALANLGLNAKGLRPSSLEMGKAERQAPAGTSDIAARAELERRSMAAAKREVLEACQGDTVKAKQIWSEYWNRDEVPNRVALDALVAQAPNVGA